MMGFFDTPAGYNDADLEMAELERRGRVAWKRTRAFTAEQLAELRAGRTVSSDRVARDTKTPYTVLVRTVDEDEYGPIFDYSVDGATWHPNAKAARTAAWG
jgi:hypothetical protein